MFAAVQMVNAEKIYAELEKFKEEYAAKKGLPYKKRDMVSLPIFKFCFRM